MPMAREKSAPTFMPERSVEVSMERVRFLSLCGRMWWLARGVEAGAGGADVVGAGGGDQLVKVMAWASGVSLKRRVVEVFMVGDVVGGFRSWLRWGFG